MITTAILLCSLGFNVTIQSSEEPSPEPVVSIPVVQTIHVDAAKTILAQYGNRNCPDGNCPLLPPSGGFQLNGVPRVSLPPRVVSRPVVAVPSAAPAPVYSAIDSIGVGDFDGDGIPGTLADYRITLRQHGVNPTGMTLDDCKVAHVSAHGVVPQAANSSACPTCPTANYGTSYSSGSTVYYGRPRGRLGDGQGWWLGKVLGRPLPAWRARRRAR